MERISVESEQDKALQVLGETLGTCWFRTNTGICDGNSCAGCPTCEKINSCYNYLDDFNKLATERIAEIHCARLMVNAPKIKEQMFEAKHGKIASNLLWVLKAWLMIMVPILVVVWYVSVCMGCSSVSAGHHPIEQPYTQAEIAEYKEKNERLILWILYESHEAVHDYNGDGKINCVDYSVAFKETWDRLLWARKDRCSFMVNKNPVTGMNHMFIVVKEVYYPWDTVKIEPQARVRPDSKDKSKIYVENYWGYKYNPAYDLEFGRFKKWLDACEWDGKAEYYIQNR